MSNIFMELLEIKEKIKLKRDFKKQEKEDFKKIKTEFDEKLKNLEKAKQQINELLKDTRYNEIFNNWFKILRIQLLENLFLNSKLEISNELNNRRNDRITGMIMMLDEIVNRPNYLLDQIKKDNKDILKEF